MIGLYNAEFCVSLRSTVDLERAIADYRRLGLSHVNGGSGTGTAELGLLYVYEGIILALGIILIRYFLTKDE